MAEECVIQADPDIIGIGVRLSLYILSLGGPFLSWILNSREFTRSINSSLGLNGLALFLAAVISTSRGTLSLFDALCIFNMLALAGIAIQPKGTYGRSADDVGEEELTRAQKTHFWAFTSFYFAAVVGALLFFIYVFAKAPVFGGQAECNSSTVYVMFGFDIVATNDVFRWIFAGGIIALLVGVLFSLAIWSGVACCWGSDCLRLVGGGGHDDGGRVRRWRFPFFLVGHVFASSYFIAMLELMIDRNTLGPGKDDWGFGQLLAVALLIGPLTEILSLLIGTVGGKEEDMPLMRRR